MSTIIQWPDGYDHPDQARDLSDADLKLAAQAAFQRNVWSPIAKATLLEVWRRWSFMVTIRDAQSDPALPPYPRPLRQSAFGPVPADGEERQ